MPNNKDSDNKEASVISEIYGAISSVESSSDSFRDFNPSSRNIVSDIDLILEPLFRSVYLIDDSISASTSLVLECRRNRFLHDPYWSIWKRNGAFFAFIEGFFHKQESRNQLSKLSKKDAEFFFSPEALLHRFKNWEELSEFFLQNKILRMRNSHAKNIYDASIKTISEFNSQVPQERWQLLGFKGYGRKITNMFLNLTFDKPEIAIDTRVFKAGIKYKILPEYFTNRFNEFKFEAEIILRELLSDSIFRLEADYILFMYGDSIRGERAETLESNITLWKET